MADGRRGDSHTRRGRGSRARRVRESLWSSCAVIGLVTAGTATRLIILDTPSGATGTLRRPGTGCFRDRLITSMLWWDHIARMRYVLVLLVERLGVEHHGSDGRALAAFTGVVVDDRSAG